MPLVFSEDVNQCLPFTIGAADDGTGPRIGGRPPDRISPRAMAEARYFATLPLSTGPSMELSLFFPMEGEVVAARSGVIHESFIAVIVHETSRRSFSDTSRSALPEHSLVLLPQKEDSFIDEEGVPVIESHHKLGGRPFLIHNEAALDEGVRSLSAAGFSHIVQFDFPAGGEDAVLDGPWPFVDGMFHLFGRARDDAWEWRWFWEL